jgi:hypothetical protein
MRKDVPNLPINLEGMRSAERPNVTKGMRVVIVSAPDGYEWEVRAAGHADNAALIDFFKSHRAEIEKDAVKGQAPIGLPNGLWIEGVPKDTLPAALLKKVIDGGQGLESKYDHPCDDLITYWRWHKKAVLTRDAYLEAVSAERWASVRDAALWGAGLWIIGMGGVYLIGWSIGWIIRGFRRSPES